MAKYCSIPYEIDAFQFDGDFMDSKGNYYVPDWAVQALKKGRMYFVGVDLWIYSFKESDDGGFIGRRHVNIGDYLFIDVMRM